MDRLDEIHRRIDQTRCHCYRDHPSEETMGSFHNEIVWMSFEIEQLDELISYQIS